MSVAIVGGNVVTETEILLNTSILIEDTGIKEVQQELSKLSDTTIQAAGCYILPGFIDLHVHGGGGADVMDLEEGALDTLSRFHAQHGTTSMLLTTRSESATDISNALHRISSYCKCYSGASAEPIGIHLEGPFINDFYKGAQSSQHILPPSLPLMKSFVEASERFIKIVTLAPEMDGADEVIAWLVEQGITVSAGHCGPDYNQMIKAIDQGVKHITHCFNGMRGFSHRDPGMLAAIMMSNKVTAELIMDTIHVAPESGRLLHHTKGSSKIALITDAMRAAGLVDGQYESAGGRTVVVEDGIVRLPSGSLAGSTLTMNQAVRNAVKVMGVKLTEAAAMASLTPAKVIGLDDRKGTIAPGKDADLVIMDSDFNVVLTIKAGQVIYQSSRW